MIVLTWALGCLIVLSEMVKQQELAVNLQGAGSLLPSRRALGAALLGLLALSGLAARFLMADQSGASPSFGSRAALMGALVCIWAAVALLQDEPGNRRAGVAVAAAGLLLILLIPIAQGWAVDLVVAVLVMALLCLWAALRPLEAGSAGRFAALAVAAAGLALALPVLVSGGWLFALLTAVLCAAILYLLWDIVWRPVLLSALALAAVSWLIGMLYTFLHAVNVREALLYLIFYQGIQPISTLFALILRPTGAIESVAQLRVLEALQSMRFLSGLYLFTFLLLLLAGASLARHAMSRVRARGSFAAYGALLAAVILGVILINQTNLRVVQADMVYKRGKPFDDQALRQNDPLNWDVAIAIYEKALDLAPLEDFYYLFLGRAYLERSATSGDNAELTALYRQAEEGLLKAQAINPLNTDHTANLARLFTRWYTADPDSDQSAGRLETAEQYYQDALALSPQNSVIRNEYARLAFELKQSCDQTLSLYEDSMNIDPFYAATYFSMTDALVACAAAQTDEGVQQELYTLAAQSIYEGLDREPKNVRAWLQAGQILQKLGEYAAALDSFARGRTADTAGSIPSWNIDYSEALVYRDMGEFEMARAMAEQALQTAPADVAGQIEAFIAALGEG